MTNKQAILAFAAIMLIGSIAIYIWSSNLMAGVEEDDEKSKNISTQIQNLFSKQKIEDYPITPAEAKWQGKFLVLEDVYTDNIAMRYSTKWNEKLGTQQNFPGDDAKGIVMITNWIKEEGSFERVLGVPSDTKAVRHSYVISYLDIAKKAVVAKDTLLGGDPPSTIRRGQSGWGKAPEDDAVVQAIKKRLK